MKMRNGSRMLTMRTVGVVAMLALVQGCAEKREDRVAFDGVFFTSNASKTGDSRADIVITVRPASQSITGALEAGRYESTRYCIDNFGTSEMDWIVGPDEDPESYAIEGDVLTLSGSCVE